MKPNPGLPSGGGRVNALEGCHTTGPRNDTFMIQALEMTDKSTLPIKTKTALLCQHQESRDHLFTVPTALLCGTKATWLRECSIVRLEVPHRNTPRYAGYQFQCHRRYLDYFTERPLDIPGTSCTTRHHTETHQDMLGTSFNATEGTGLLHRNAIRHTRHQLHYQRMAGTTIQKHWHTAIPGAIKMNPTACTGNTLRGHHY